MNSRLQGIKRFLLLFVVAIPMISSAQNVGISGVAITPDPEALLELRSTTKGVLLPRLDNTERAALQATPLGAGDKGLTIYNRETDLYNYWDGTQWVEIQTVGAGSGAYIENQSAADQAADFRINGNGSMLGALGVGTQASIGTARVLVHDASAGANELQLLVEDFASLPILAVEDIGRVGIGTSAPISTLDVVGKESVRVGTDLLVIDPGYLTGPSIGFGSTTTPDVHMRLGYDGTSDYWDTKTQDLRIYSASSANSLFIESSDGSIGMGTITPSDNLHIYEDVNAGIGITIENPNTSSSSSSSLLFDYTGGEYAGIYSRSASYSGAPDHLQIVNNHGAGSVIEMVTNGSGRMEIDDAGSVTLTDYNSASSGLIYANSTGTLFKNDYSGSSADVLTGDGNWTTLTSLLPNDNDWTISGNNIYNANIGNVGIGTSSPNLKLELAGGDIGIGGTGAMVFGGWATATPDNTPEAQLVLDGAHNTGHNLGGGTKLLIRGMDNEVSVKAISVVDENSNELFFLESMPTGFGQSYFRGSVGMGITTPAEDLHVYRDDNDIARVYATGGSQGSGMFFAGQSTSYGGGFAYDGDGTPTLVGDNDRITFFRRNNNTDTDVMSYAYNGSTVRMSALAGTGTRPIYAAANGDITATGPTSGADGYWTRTGSSLSPTSTDQVDMNSQNITEVQRLITLGTSDYDKLRVYSSNNYTIGMHSAMSFGYLNDWATTFTMNTDSDRGWVWRDVGDAQSDGAMSLTTGGQLYVKSTIGMPNQATMQARNTGGALETFMWPRWSDNIMYMNYGSGGFRLRDSGSSTAIAIDANRTVTIDETLWLDCNDCGSTSTLAGGSDWGNMSIQGRVMSANSNIHLSPPGNFNVIINDTYRAAGGSTSGQDAGLIVEGYAAVGQASLNTSYRLIVNGRFKSTGINETSDARLKKNVDNIGGALNNVLQMQGVTYEWKKDEFPEKNFTEGTEYGLIAQELEKILPDLVDTDEEGFKSIQYTHLVPVLIEALKEQNSIISNQASDIEFLKAKAEVNAKLIREHMDKNSNPTSDK